MYVPVFQFLGGVYVWNVDSGEQDMSVGTSRLPQMKGLCTGLYLLMFVPCVGLFCRSLLVDVRLFLFSYVSFYGSIVAKRICPLAFLDCPS